MTTFQSTAIHIQDQIYHSIRHTPELARFCRQNGQGSLVMKAYIDGQVRADLTDEALLNMAVDTGVEACFPEEAKTFINAIKAQVKNVVIAGGYILNQLIQYHPEHSDIDVFLTGALPESITINPPDATKVLTLGSSIRELHLPNRNWHIQMIYASASKSPLQIVSDFDIDACKVFVRNGTIWLMPDAFMALATRTVRNVRFNVLSVSSAGIVKRLRKMFKKGFRISNEVDVPEFQLSDLSETQEPTKSNANANADADAEPVALEEKHFELALTSLRPMQGRVVYGSSVVQASNKIVCISDINYQVPSDLSLRVNKNRRCGRIVFHPFKDIAGVSFITPVAPIFFLSESRIRMDFPLQQPGAVNERFQTFCDSLCQKLSTSLSNFHNSFSKVTMTQSNGRYFQIYLDLKPCTLYWLRNQPSKTHNAQASLREFAKQRLLRGRLHILMDGVFEIGSRVHQRLELQGIELEDDDGGSTSFSMSDIISFFQALETHNTSLAGRMQALKLN